MAPIQAGKRRLSLIPGVIKVEIKRDSTYGRIISQRVEFAPLTELRAKMPHVKVRENEPFDVALRRFKRSCEKAGVLSEVRRREFYEKPTAVRKRKAAAAVKRHAKKLQREARKYERAF